MSRSGWSSEASGWGVARVSKNGSGLKTWVETHMDDVIANRATYDTGTD